MSSLRRFVFLLVCGLLLAACEIRSYVDIDMSDLSNGSVLVQVGFDEQFREAMEEFGGGTDLLSELESDAPAEGWAVDRFVDGDIEGVALSKSFTSLEELQAIVEEGRISGPQEGLVGEMTFTDTGDTIRFEADVPDDADLGGDLEGFDPEQVEGLLTYDARIRVTFPGDVIDHNGELVENTVTWEFEDPTSMAGAELFAEARKGSGSVALYLLAAVLGLGVIALVVWQVLRRRNPPTDSPITGTDGPIIDGLAIDRFGTDGLASTASEDAVEPPEVEPAQPSNESA